MQKSFESVQNMHVLLDKLWFLVDFEVLSMKGIEECPKIFGKTFFSNITSKNLCWIREDYIVFP